MDAMLCISAFVVSTTFWFLMTVAAYLDDV